MYKVEVIKQCGCFTKSGLPSEYKFDSQADAISKANELAAKFNKEFCEKHKFKTAQDGNTIKIIEDEEA